MEHCHLNSADNRTGAHGHTRPPRRAILDLSKTTIGESSSDAVHSLTAIDDMDLMDISSLDSTGTIPALGSNQTAMPKFARCTEYTAKTCARRSVQHQPSQLSSNTQAPPQHNPQLSVQENKDNNVNSRSPPLTDDGSASHLAFKDRPQLYEWLNETSNSNITITERLQKFNWVQYETQTLPVAATGGRLRELDILASL